MGKESCPDPRLLFVGYPGGTWEYYYKNCGRWTCDPCLSAKFTRIAIHLATHAFGDVWAGRVPPAYASAAGRATKVGKGTTVQYLRITLTDGSVYLVADSRLRGRGWGLPATGLQQVVEDMGTWPHERPKRTTWRGWPAMTEQAEERRTTFCLMLRSFAQMERLVAEAGLDITKRVWEDPEDAAERLLTAHAKPAPTGKTVLYLP